MPMRPREMVKLLKKNGFVEVDQHGSHLKMINYETGKSTVVPMHSRELKIGLQKAILKEAGIKEEKK